MLKKHCYHMSSCRHKIVRLRLKQKVGKYSQSWHFPHLKWNWKIDGWWSATEQWTHWELRTRWNLRNTQTSWQDLGNLGEISAISVRCGKFCCKLSVNQNLKHHGKIMAWSLQSQRGLGKNFASVALQQCSEMHYYQYHKCQNHDGNF